MGVFLRCFLLWSTVETHCNHSVNTMVCTVFTTQLALQFCSSLRVNAYPEGICVYCASSSSKKMMHCVCLLKETHTVYADPEGICVYCAQLFFEEELCTVCGFLKETTHCMWVSLRKPTYCKRIIFFEEDDAFTVHHLLRRR